MQDAPAVAWPHAARRPARLLRLAGDERLVALVRRGEEAAFEAIYDRYHRQILGFCRHMLGSREEAEDAVQHTFLAAYRDLAGSAKRIELRPWLFAIARNRCLSILRARREQVPLDAAEPATEGLAVAVQRREDVRELLGDLARLPEDQRAALLLSELGALDHAGIAAVLGCRQEKVKALVFQARSSLAASREARATPCGEIREQLATATGGGLRRGPLRRHLRDCAGCRAFQAEVKRQRALLAVALPVLPTLGLKAASLPGGGAAAHAAAAGGIGTVGTGAAGATGAGVSAGGSALTAIASAGAAKVAVGVLTAAALAGGGALTLHATRDARSPRSTTAGATTTFATAASSAPAARLLAAAGRLLGPAAAHAAGTVPPRGAAALGFLPTRAPGRGGNGPAARTFAHGRDAAAAHPRSIATAHAHAGAPSGRRTAPASGRPPAAGLAPHRTQAAPSSPARTRPAPPTRHGDGPGPAAPPDGGRARGQAPASTPRANAHTAPASSASPTG